MHRSYVVRIAVFLFFVCIWVFFLVKQLFWIQIDRHQELSQKARALCSYSVSEKGRRGSILDRNGQLLAADVIYFNVSAYKPKFTSYRHKKKKVKVTTEDLIHDFNLVFQTPKDVLERRLKSGQKQIVVAKEIEVSLVEMIKSDQFEKLPLASLLKHPKLFKRLDFEKSYRRFYPNDKLLAHVIGYQSYDDNQKQDVGRIGVEKAWNEHLRPKKEGKISNLRGAQGNIIQFSEVSRTEPEHGSNVYLTIREQIQNIIEMELAKMVKDFSPKSAYVIMANPKTGAILGMAQYPSFNLNDRSSYKAEQLKNKMLLDYFDPGSTMKGVSIAAALDAGVVSLDDVFYCEKGRWHYGGKSLKDAGHSYEDLTVAEIVQKSSNIGTAKVSIELGKYKLWTYLRNFGFGQAPNTGLGPEGTGILLRPKNWYKVSITRIPMGQGISVTAMQLVQAYCALANDGVMMQLYAVDRIEDPNVDKVTVFQPKVKRRVISSRAAKDIVSALSMVTKSGGTARRADIEGIDVAGKTGTAEQAVGGRYTNKYVSSFIGFLPAEDPEFVLMVVAEEPKKSHYGGVVAAPTFKNISVKTLKYLQTDPLDK